MSFESFDPSYCLLGRRGMPPAVRRLIVVTCVLVGIAAFVPGLAAAAVTHVFLPEVSAKVTEGVPAGSGAALTGALGSPLQMSGDSGHMWLAEGVEETKNSRAATRVDEVDASTGVFIRQLNEEGGVGSLVEGLAVGSVAGEEQVYVGAGANNEYVVGVFGSSGRLQGVWNGANTVNKTFSGNGSQEVAKIDGVATDRSASLGTAGDVYVSTANDVGVHQEFDVIDVFKPGIAGVEPEVVGELRGTCNSPGVCSGSEVVPFKEPESVAVSGFNGDVLVDDGASVVDVFEPVAGMPGVYSFLFKLTGTPNGMFKAVRRMAVNGKNGNIYLLDQALDIVAEFGPEGRYVGELTGTPTGPSGRTRPFGRIESVGVDSSSGNVFIAEDHLGPLGRGKTYSVDVFGGDVVIPDVVTEGVSEVGVASAVLHGEVDPLGVGEASCGFVWGTTRAFGQVVSCEPERVADGSGLVAVRAKLTGLAPDTEYCYRLQATTVADAQTNPGEAWQDQCFKTIGPGLDEESVSGVSSTSATFAGKIDPDNAATSYYFQYGPSTEYGFELPLAPGASLGSGKGDVPVVRHVQGLTADTTYHYRLVAVSEVAGVTETFFAADHTFVTQPSGSAFVLPDGREWEMVSPPDKHGAVLVPIEEEGIVQSASSGGAFTYLASLPTDPGAAGYSEFIQVIAGRSTAGWSSHDISLPHSQAAGTGLGNGQEYRFFSEDLSQGLAEPFGPYTSLGSEAFPPESERTPVIRHDATCTTNPTPCYRPLVTGAPGYENVPAGTVFGGDPTGREPVQFVGSTPDLSHVILSSHVPLTEPLQAGELSHYELYEWSAGAPATQEPRAVSVLPNGKASTVDAAFGAPGASPSVGIDTRGAINADGSRVVWSGGGHLYSRDTVAAKTVQLDIVQPGASGSGTVSAEFQFASTDGSRVFFTDSQRLTGDAGETGRDLYECTISESAGEPVCDLTDLTPGVNGETANVRGVLVGGSSDGSTLYFVANGVLAPGAKLGNCLNGGESAPGSTCNLYELHYDGNTWEAPRLVAVLGAEDWPSWDGYGVFNSLQELTSRVSSDGRFLVFMSDQSLTGYDNRDANTGKPDEEVYLYDSQANTGAGRLTCVSCDPTGARPAGVEYATLRQGPAGVEGKGGWLKDQGVAANVPGWTSYSVGLADYQSRYLSDQGRVFFTSSDALVPQDINHTEDVYEYEPAGLGDCTTSSSTFSETSNGCVGLISSGTSANESGFLDASENGDDVFFLAADKLVPQDPDTALDIYDAHACSTTSPCTSAPVAPPACTTADACRLAPVPQPAIFGAPASATFNGQGNVPQTPPFTTIKAKTLTRTQKLTRALNACHKDKRKNKRNRCERQARRRYGNTQSQAKKTSAKGRG